MPTSKGTIRLFQIAGIHVFLHWSWFLVALYEIGERKGRYSSIGWNILEYLALFVIVTMHEFGHALACRRVGGTATQIVLWPLGGVAYVSPPPRPGATLWSIAAGPLVNVALLPILGILILVGSSSGLTTSSPNLTAFLSQLSLINLVLLLFNVLPIYPLDGGKILRALLWYVVGRAQSLMASVIIGFIGIAGIAYLAFGTQSAWLAILAVFGGMQCFNGFKQARALRRLEAMPRREGFACPSCQAQPPMGELWQCGFCRKTIDTFETNFTCPRCNTKFPKTTCPECGVMSLATDWAASREPVLAGSSGIIGAKAPSPPSILPVVFGVTASLGAIVLLLLSLLFFKVASDQTALQPRYQTEIERLWASAGISIPGEQTLTLQTGERYSAYVESGNAALAGRDKIDIRIVDAESGQTLVLRPAGTFNSLQRQGRTLLPTASFLIPKSGLYTVHASGPVEAADASVKIGPPAELLSGSTATVSRGVAIGAAGIALILVVSAVLLFVFYIRRRSKFSRMLQ